MADETKQFEAVKRMEADARPINLVALDALLPKASVSLRYYIRRAMKNIRRKNGMPDLAEAVEAPRRSRTPVAEDLPFDTRYLKTIYGEIEDFEAEPATLIDPRYLRSIHAELEALVRVA